MDREITKVAKALLSCDGFDSTILAALGDQAVPILTRLLKGKEIPAFQFNLRIGAEGVFMGSVQLTFLHCPQPQEIIDELQRLNPEIPSDGTLMGPMIARIRDNKVRFAEVKVRG